ncbi:MAG: MFS transporter [SAR202 cluster bacterium]|nr:MFS transporter [SAR202 cluster bacterium]
MNLFAFLTPRPTLNDDEVAHGLRMMTWEHVASLSMFSVTTSGLLAAFALALGASNLQIGILAGIPFITQPLQIPAILLVERLRRRKAISLLTWVPAQFIWIPIALIPFFIDTPSSLAIVLLLVLMSFRGVLTSMTSCAFNGWIRDLVPQHILGSFFGRRLALATAASMIFGLAGAFFVDLWQDQSSAADSIFAYSYVLIAGAVFLGLSAPLFMARMPEPLMPPVAGPQPSLFELLKVPLRDKNFRQLVNFLFFWGFAANLAIPFFTIFMLQRLDFPLSAVIALNTLAQLTNVLFVRVWGPFADRFGSKPVLSACASLYVLVIAGWAFTTLPEKYFMTVPLVIALQLFSGVAASGVSLTVSTIGLKLAPQGGATSYMAVASLATNLGAGLGPLAGGVFADFFSVRKLSLTFEWLSPARTVEFNAINLAGMDFLFGIAALLGLIALNTLTTIREEGEVGREVLLEELMAPTRYMSRTIGSVPGVRWLSGYPYSYLRRVPGIEVAVGATAYQVASSTRTAVSAMTQSGVTAAQIARQVGRSVTKIVAGADDLGEFGIDIALHATRGAMHAVDGITADVGRVARGTVSGVLEALGEYSLDPFDLAYGAGYGTIQGSGEAEEDLATTAIEAVAGALEAAAGLGLSPEDAAAQTALGALAAAQSLGPEAETEVREAFKQEGIPVDEPATGD